jgi:hypothetical protein
VGRDLRATRVHEPRPSTKIRGAAIVRRKHAVLLSIPLIVVFLPDFFKVALTGAVNVGLVYLIAQYLVGTVIAIRYTVLLKRLDDMAGDLSENRWVAIDTAPAL